MRLYYVPRTRATRPRWVLEELGIPYELVRLDPSKGETRAAEHRARHPLGHVPVLEDGEVRIFESAAICLWLGERFPEKGLLPPPGTPGRALAYQWLFYAATELEPACGVLSAQNRKAEAERSQAAISEAKEKFRNAAAALGPAVAKGHLLGEAFSVVDAVVGAILSWGKGFGALPEAPAVEAYLTRLKQRPAYKRAFSD